jgi:hypothetical protein
MKSGEELVGEPTSESANKADPDRPIPFPFHADLAIAIRRIQR